MPTDLPETRPVPRAVVLLSGVALAVPVAGTLFFSRALGEYASLLWLAALIPAFALSYFRGTRGVATAVALGIVTLAATEAVAAWLLLPIPSSLPWVVVAFLAIAMWIGVHTEFLHRERDAVERMALTDALTGLPNRRHALTHLAKEFAAAQRGRAISVVLFDLDRFKHYNDTFGHAAGDTALTEFGQVLSTLTRRMNLSGRLGGEEFVSILGGAESDGAVIFAERVLNAIRELEIGDPPLTVSAGVASYQPGMEAPEDLLAAADEALYQAKRDGRDCIRVHQGGPSTLTPFPLRRRNRDFVATGEAPDAGVTATVADGIGSGQRVLVVEGDAMVREILDTFLGGEGFDTATAEDAPGAFRHLETEFDIVVSDLALPGGGGLELVSAVRARWPRTQIVVMTGIEGTRVAGGALRAGADSYLVKPFGVPEMKRHLAEALDRIAAARAQTPEPTATAGAARERDLRAREAVLQGVTALVKAVETRDPYTNGHSERVAAYAGVLAEAVDPAGSRLDRETLSLACRLHDVGKIRIPDAVLNKEGTLTEAEIELVRAHPRIGRQMLAPLLDEEMILAVASWHHERWDGSGYPDRLVGGAIPLAARVVCVADVLDAMTRPRAYRDALSWEEAVSRIRQESGTGYDPEVVAAMEASLARLREIHDGN